MVALIEFLFGLHHDVSLGVPTNSPAPHAKTPWCSSLQCSEALVTGRILCVHVAIYNFSVFVPCLINTILIPKIITSWKFCSSSALVQYGHGVGSEHRLEF